MQPPATNPAATATKAPTKPMEVAPPASHQHAGQYLDFPILEPLCSVFRRKLKAEGLKYTPERAQILETVIRLGTPTSTTTPAPAPTPTPSSTTSPTFHADRILADVRIAGFNVSKATMYRTLKLLLDARIIARALGDGDQTHFRFCYGGAPLTIPPTAPEQPMPAPSPDPLAISSHHLHRTDTGRTEHLDDPALATLASTLRNLCAQHGLTYQGHRLEVRASALPS